MPIRMVDISAKKKTDRIAKARARLVASAATIRLIKSGQLAKGDCLAAAQAAGILAAKNTALLIPLCHQIPLASVAVDFSFGKNHVVIGACVKAAYATGVEMEALSACAAAALTIYDMAKAYEPQMVVEDLRLVEKRGGKSDFCRRQRS